LSGKPTALPDFANPPLVEVALAAQFHPLEAFQTVHAGLLWQRFRERFPKVEEHEPLPHVEEAFGPSRPGRLSIQVGEADRPADMRVWFMNEAETELIQVQRDRFIHNWRRPGGYAEGESEYPHYSRLREKFAENLALFEQFLASEELGQPVVNQCELTYVNEIKALHSEIAHIVTILAPPTGRSLPIPEDVTLRLRYVIPDEHGEPAGRLHVELQPAFRRISNDEAFVMNLTARGRPIGKGVDGVLRFLDLAHDWALRAFVDLTSEDMHLTWGKYGGS